MNSFKNMICYQIPEIWVASFVFSLILLALLVLGIFIYGLEKSRTDAVAKTLGISEDRIVYRDYPEGIVKVDNLDGTYSVYKYEFHNDKVLLFKGK